MKTETIVTTYEGIEIEYDESRNQWRFELRGRERFSDSLAKAKEAIDKPEPQKKTPFNKFKAYKSVSRWDSAIGFKVVEVTSIAERSYSRPEVWISSDGNRSKESASDLFQICPENDALVAEITALSNQQKSLATQEQEKRNALKRIELPADEASA